jgi:glycosyltransferase involved in cell wall biosynthesis
VPSDHTGATDRALDRGAPLRVLVVAHNLKVGGSQRCAVDLACGVRARGHDVTVAGPTGPLAEVLHAAGVPFRPLDDDRPGQAVSQALPGYRRLLELTRELDPDVVHAYELTPAILGYAGPHLRDHRPLTMTINSMSVPDFMPASVPLQVCNPVIAEEVRRRVHNRSGPVGVLEIPTDTTNQYPGYPGGDEFRAGLGIAPDEQAVVIVSRFARALKQEGLETAIRAAGRLAERRMRLVLVGDGPAMPDLRALAERTNAAAGREVVLLTGEILDPRPAYAAADVVVGMGGSLLRAMAFGKPCVVQGERGFFKTLDLDSAREFRWRGFYGLGDGGNGEDRLVSQLGALLDDPAQRELAGRTALGLVRRHYSLDVAVDHQIAWYRLAMARKPRPSNLELARTAAAIGTWFGGRKITRPTGQEKTDFFNSPTRIEPGMRAPVPSWFDPELDGLLDGLPGDLREDANREPAPTGSGLTG